MTSHVPRIRPGIWAPGKDVVIRDGMLHCQLDFERRYPFVAESAGFLETRFQRDQPYFEFLEVTNEQDLARFVKRWGPIVLSADDKARGKSTLPLSRYWLAQRYLQRVVHLFSAFRHRSGEAQGLGGFLELRSDFVVFLQESAKIEGWKVPDNASYLKWLSSFVDAVTSLPTKTDWIGVRAGAEGQIARILEDSPPAYVRRFMDLTISNCFEVTTVPQPRRPKRERERVTIVPRLKTDELEKALEYMVLLNAWSAHPLHQCDDCGRVFPSETRRPRRYCSPECARRVSSRVYKRTIRARQKRDLTRTRLINSVVRIRA